MTTYEDDTEDSSFEIGFEEGIKTGKALGEYDTYNRVVNAISLGELDLWLEFNAPKPVEGWDAWIEKHGPLDEFRSRWDHPRTD